MTIPLTAVLVFVRSEKHWVLSTVAGDGKPEGAVVGVAVDDDFTVVFDTSTASRKWRNMANNGRVAFVMWKDACTVQYEGAAELLCGSDLVAAKELYFAYFPDGKDRESWPDIGYVRVRPTWMRRSDFGEGGPTLTEWTFSNGMPVEV
jgi:pyridoxine/pyridoxamine 5'-phosphate oxidase